MIVGTDPEVNQHAIIAVHSTARGPGLGGMRMWPFRSEKEALADVLRLSKAMSAKAAMAGLKLGGGKSVIIGDPAKDKSRELFRQFGQMVQSLKGAYIAAEDSGILPPDLNLVAEKTRHITGLSPSKGGSGVPSTGTAQGVLYGIQTSLREVFGAKDLDGCTVAIQGVGSVGLNLAKLLIRKKAKLIVSDIDKERCALAARLGAKVVRPDRIHAVKAEVFAPCALGGILNAKTIPRIKAAIVAGGANNQFQNARQDPYRLARRGILHAPDYVINAGGLIRLYVKEVVKTDDLAVHLRQVAKTLAEVYEIARAEKKPPQVVADRLAEEKIKAATARRRATRKTARNSAMSDATYCGSAR